MYIHMYICRKTENTYLYFRTFDPSPHELTVAQAQLGRHAKEAPNVTRLLAAPMLYLAGS